MSQFLVEWKIDIEADTPVEAAKEAMKIVRNPKTIATVFDVIDENGDVTQVDLEYE